MYCHGCGTKAYEAAKFCAECGCKLSDSVAPIEGNAQRVYTVKAALKDYFQGAIGETKLRDIIRKGKIPHTRIGTRIILREEALDKWIAEQEYRSIQKEAAKGELPRKLRAI